MTALKDCTTVFGMDITIGAARAMRQTTIHTSARGGADDISPFSSDMTMALRTRIAFMLTTSGTHSVGAKGIALLTRSTTGSADRHTFRWQLIRRDHFPTVDIGLGGLGRTQLGNDLATTPQPDKVMLQGGSVMFASLYTVLTTLIRITVEKYAYHLLSLSESLLG